MKVRQLKFCQHTTKVFAKAGRDIGAIGSVQASAVVPADIYKFDFYFLTSTLNLDFVQVSQTE